MSYVLCPDCNKRIVDKRRYPVEPFAMWMDLSPGQACRAVGLSGSTQKAARCHGLSRQSVETIAARLRIHPSEVWPEVIAHDIEDHMKQCIQCGAGFMPPDRSRTKCCSDACRKTRAAELERKRNRERYHNDPRYREYRKAKARKWGAANKRARTVKNRKWREENAEYDLERHRAYREANREKINASRRERYARQRSAS